MSQNPVNQFDANGERHGIWTKNFEGTKEVRYSGQFEHGKEIGEFKYYQIVGTKSKLAATKIFNPDNDIAEVTFLTLKGKPISEGKMKGKLYIGKWVYYHKNSDVIMTIENYNDQGQLHGPKSVFYDTGAKAEELNYVNGKLQGESKYYSLDGVLVKSYIYDNAELHGMSKHYNGNGDLVIEGPYKRGKKTGIWKYYRNGELYDQKDFTYVPKFKKKQ
ncbi:MAG: toxin-antitoxin system YwqK family antitoxin [Flavobacteriaceae bacterium]|nr:MAG: toxin-antitoxin system YwqK family antitoxin [Flavobacteriaceae bacterium]